MQRHTLTIGQRSKSEKCLAFLKCVLIFVSRAILCTNKVPLLHDNPALLGNKAGLLENKRGVLHQQQVTQVGAGEFSSVCRSYYINSSSDRPTKIFSRASCKSHRLFFVTLLLKRRNNTKKKIKMFGSLQ
jgi:hypothetical protein